VFEEQEGNAAAAGTSHTATRLLLQSLFSHADQ
jgi:hypothetical protein